MRYLLIAILFFFCFSLFSVSQTNISTVGTLSYPKYLSDIWGYQKLNGDELALVTTVNGFSVVDISTPSNPTEIFYKTSSKPDTWWRDVKTWDKYAFVVSEASEGLYIVDLEALPGTVNDTYYAGSSYPFTRAHNIYIDENGVAYIFGSNYGAGGVIMLDVATDPMKPIELGVYDDYYVHDGVARGDTLWASCINNGFQTVIDVSNKSNPTLEASWYTPNNFAHNCWPSDDGNYLYTTDEKPGAYITAYDVSDINNAVELDKIRSNHGTSTVPHNVHFMNDYLITSYYNDGITIYDATHPNFLVETGYIDTEPAYSGNAGGNSNDYYWGAWGVYPWLPSGLVIVSDVLTGLHVLNSNYTRASFIEGVVTDSCGNSLSDVQVEILIDGTTATSSNDGSFLVGTLNSGDYDIQFSKSGYETVVVSSFNLINGVDAQLNVMLGQTGVQYLKVSIDHSIENCSNNLSANAQNGGSNYNYLWSNSATLSSISGLNGGIYHLTVNDNLGCEAITSITISDIENLSVTSSITNSSCGSSSGSIDINVVSGNSPYAYLWTNESTVSTNSGLAQGFHSVTVTDASGCEINHTFFVGSDNGPVISVDNVLSVTCNGGSDGAVTVSASGLGTSFSFAWDNSFQNTGTTSIVSGLSAGIYYAQVEDENECITVEIITVSEAEPIDFDITFTEPFCKGYNGTATVVHYGTLSTYIWSDPNAQVGLTAYNLYEGEYCVSVGDVNGCQDIGCVTLTSNPLMVLDVVTVVEPSCNGYSDGMIVIKDTTNQACCYNWTWIAFTNNDTLDYIHAGSYDVVATDDFGCSAYIQNISVGEPNAISINVTITNANTNISSDGEFNVIFSGGTSPYTYNWSNGATVASISGLDTGSYVVTITDANGCVKISDELQLEANSIIDMINEFKVYSIKIYPNPVNETLYVDFDNINSKITIELSDVLGKIFLKKEYIYSNSIDVSKLPKGLYNITFYSNSLLVGSQQFMK